MKIILRFLFFSILSSLIIGFYFKNYENDQFLGEKIIGSTVLFSVIFFLPLFLYHRWKDKDIRDYTLTEENYERMRNEVEKKKDKIKCNKSFQKRELMLLSQNYFYYIQL